MSCTYCGTTCYTSCMYGCDGCDNTCAGGCRGCTGCTGTCKGSCTGCTGDCKEACNTTCSTTVQANNIAKLKLDNNLTAKLMTDLIAAVDFELTGRGRNLTPTHTITIEVNEQIDDTKINNIIENLTQAGQTAGYTAVENATVELNLIEDLIAKVKAANEATVGLP